MRGHYSGIGLESALLFAQEGANVLLVDVNIDAAEKAAKLVAERAPNVGAVAFKADVSKEDEVKAAVDKAVEAFGRLDVVVRPSPTNSILKAVILTRFGLFLFVSVKASYDFICRRSPISDVYSASSILLLSAILSPLLCA